MANTEILQVPEDNTEERALSIKEQLKRSPEVLQIAASINVSDAILSLNMVISLLRKFQSLQIKFRTMKLKL